MEAYEAQLARSYPFGITRDDMRHIIDLELGGLPTIVLNSLVYWGYRTRAQVAAAADVDLLAMPNIGKTYLKAIRALCPREGVRWVDSRCPHCGGTGRVPATPG